MYADMIRGLRPKHYPKACYYVLRHWMKDKVVIPIKAANHELREKLHVLIDRADDATWDYFVRKVS